MSKEKETNQEITEESMTENTEETVKDSEVTEEASEETTEQEAVSTEDKDEKKSIFGKKKSKLEEKIAELEDARMRQLAEFENFRKRSEKEKSQMFEVGAKSVVEKILPVIDNF